MKEDELKEIFLAEALDGYEQLNRFFTRLEKDSNDPQAVEAIFRITHTLKANAAAMGYDGIAEVSHLLEDIFSEVKKQPKLLNSHIFNDLFRANDKLGEMIAGIKSEAKVQHKGILTKLKVIRRELSDKQTTTEAPELINQEQAVGGAVQEIQNSEQLAFSDLVQVPIRKLDSLLNLVGELIIERDRLMAKNVSDSYRRNNEYSSLHRLTSDLQYAVMNVRLVQVNLMFMKFHRIVRDVANMEGKKVDLVLEGTEIEIDRNVLQIISDSMVHLVRNAVSHGIESAEERIKSGKSEIGLVKLHAKAERDSVVIEISDDGRGIDADLIRKKLISKHFVSKEIAEQLSDSEIVNYIFESGFSSADQVTAVSGRGVGMDVVKNAINSIGGKISLQTEVGEGTIFRLSVPASMAVKSVMLFDVMSIRYAIPLVFTEAVVSFSKKDFYWIGKTLIVHYLETAMPIVFLKDLFGIAAVRDIQNSSFGRSSFENLLENEKIYVILITFGNRQVGLVVDKLIQQKEIVEKPLKYPLNAHKLMSGATILGSGNVCLVLDIPSMMGLLFGISKFSVTTVKN
jgi:two-component system, chemotaxis family, sensor kinase CheA